jgi:hypothetical protein
MFKFNKPRILTMPSISAIVSVPILAAVAAFVICGMMMSNAEAVRKIGPGYARMQPINLGRPEKIAYSTPYYMRVAAPLASRANHLAPSNIATLTTASSLVIVAEAVPSSYSRPDIHRVY